LSSRSRVDLPEPDGPATQEGPSGSLALSPLSTGVPERE